MSRLAPACVAAFLIEQKAHITPVVSMLAVAVPVGMFLALLHALYSFLVRRFHSIDAWLLISSTGIAMISVIAALCGVSPAACLALLMFAPATTTYELWGYQRQVATLAHE